MKNLCFKLKNNIFKILIELLIFNRFKRARIKAGRAKSCLKKYVKEADRISYENIQENENDNIIWQYWHTGRENAPKLIQECFNSIEKFNPDKKINVLSLDTIKNYVNLPQKYYDLVNSKKMSIAHFSDILRLYLLCEYGGTWIDSTIYLTDKIPDEIFNSVFFVPSKTREKDYYDNIMSCFLIRAKKGCKNIKALKAVLEKYWEDFDFAFNYFMFEHIATMLSSFPSLKEEWEKMPKYDALKMGKLQEIIHNNFNESEFNKIKEETSIHKLSYKVIEPNTTGGSYFDYLTDNLYKKRVSVVIPTLQKKTEILDKLIKSLEDDQSVSEIILIDNSLKGYKEEGKLRVIVPKENLYVNLSWNLGVKEAKEEIVALLNDDIIIPADFCKNIIHQMTPEMGIVGYNSGCFVKPIKENTDFPKGETSFLEKTSFMDLYFGIAMFFYKSSYYEIPEDIKVVYGDVWIYHKNLKNGKKNYKVSGQTIFHWGSLSSSNKALTEICKKDAKNYKRKMISWKDRLFSFDNTWSGFKIRLFGITFRFKQKKKGY